MAEIPDPHNLSLEDLMAFADGELEPQRHKEILRLLALNPDAMAQVSFHHQLRQAVRRSVEAATPVTPADLAARIAAEATEAPAPHAAPTFSTPRGPAPSPAHGRRLRFTDRFRLFSGWPAGISSLVAAAIILAVGLLVLQLLPPNGAQAALSAQTVSNLVHEHHRFCLKLPDIHKDVQEIGMLVPDTERILRSKPYTLLDLTPVGFRFVGAKTCQAPGATSMHVFYQPIDLASGHKKLSLWIERDTGRMPNLRKAEEVHVTVDTATFDPIVYWKHDGMIYYLVSDSAQDIQAAVHFFQTGEGPRVQPIPAASAKP